MYKSNFLALLITGIFLFTACSTDDTPVPSENTDYANGIFILNEGLWGEGNSTVSFLDPVTQEVDHQIFQHANNGMPLGDTGQNMGFYKDYAFVVMNVSNTIEIVNRYTFKSVGTIDTEIQNPRYITFFEGKAFVSNWGDGMNPEDDFISVFNAEDLSLVETIPVAEGPEKLFSENGKIYVAHSGGYNINDKISVIDGVKLELEAEIGVGAAPNSLLTEGGFLWVLSGGTPSYAGEESAGVLTKIDPGTNQVVQQITFANSTDHPANLEDAGGIFYYTLGNSVYGYDGSSEVLPGTPLFDMEQVDYLYGFKVEGAQIFAVSANPDFTGNGKLVIYDLSGNLLSSFETGVNPNGIYPNN